jgi:hypothetical protein
VILIPNGPLLRVVVTPGGVMFGHMEHTDCHQLNRVLAAAKERKQCLPTPVVRLVTWNILVLAVRV